MLVQHVYDSPSVVDAAIADVNERGRGKRLEHVVPLGSNLDDLDLLRRLREVEKDSYGKVVAEETGEREKLKKKKDSRKTKWQQIKYNDRSTKY